MPVKLLTAILYVSMLHSQNIFLVNGHAHNDYYHRTPLGEALYYGFNSVEADVLLLNDTLFVAHDTSESKSNRLFDHLYLKTLQAIAHQNKGWIQHDKIPFVLLIDIKSDSLQTYRHLHKMLGNYDHFVTSYSEDGHINQRAVNVVISGNRPVQYMKNQALRYATIDGRLSDIGSRLPLTLLWLISEDARKCFQWRGSGDIPQSDLDFLSRTVESVHEKGRKIRFWATFDDPGLQRARQWDVFLKNKVDFINTDDLRGFWLYMLEKQNKGEMQ